MRKNEIALQLTLKALEKPIEFEDISPTGLGLAISQLYNEIYRNIDTKSSEG